MDFLENKYVKWIGLALISFLFFYMFAGLWPTIFIFVMIGLHEYGHLLAAKIVGIKTAGFYFIPLGGVALIKKNPSEQWKKYIIAYGGPLTGLLLCLIALGFMLVLSHNLLNLDSQTIYRCSSLAFYAIFIWSIINVFNLLPIYPFDGGRLLAALCKSKNKSGVFEKVLIALSWVSLGLTLLYTKSFFIVVLIIIGLVGEYYRKKGMQPMLNLSIGRLENNYRVKPPLKLYQKFLGWFAYIMLTLSFVGCVIASWLFFY